MSTQSTGEKLPAWMVLLAMPFRMVLWVFKHPKILILMVVLVGAFIGFRACNAQISGDARIPDYQKTAPTVLQAPYVFSTGTRLYYVKDYTETDTQLKLTNYYTYEKTKWVQNTKPLTMDKKYFPELKRYVRTAK